MGKKTKTQKNTILSGFCIYDSRLEQGNKWKKNTNKYRILNGFCVQVRIGFIINYNISLLHHFKALLNNKIVAKNIGFRSVGPNFLSFTHHKLTIWQEYFYSFSTINFYWWTVYNQCQTVILFRHKSQHLLLRAAAAVCTHLNSPCRVCPNFLISFKVSAFIWV